MLVWYHIDTWLIVSLSFSSCHGVVSCYMIAIIHDLQKPSLFARHHLGKFGESLKLASTIMF